MRPLTIASKPINSIVATVPPYSHPVIASNRIFVRKAGKAKYFFEQLQRFNYSCEQRAMQLCGSEFVKHTPIRIAVLDTGININNGGIAGGLMLGRIKDADCYSWVGNDPTDVHDSHGHGTNMTNLFLKVAPLAEICVAKVFSGNEFCVEEAKNVAKVRVVTIALASADHLGSL